MAEYGIKDIQQHISKALRQLKDGDRPIITSSGQAIAAIITMQDMERLNSMTNIQFALLLQEYARQIERERKQLHEAIAETEMDPDNPVLFERRSGRMGASEYIVLDGLRDLAAAIRGSADTLIKRGDE